MTIGDQFNSLVRREIRYPIGVFTIRLPSDHALPGYQRKYPTYDRFLQFLAAELPEGTIIDVGANVGDSIAAMASANDRHDFAAVEPSPQFQAYLRRNIEAMQAERPGLKIANYACFLSADLPITGQSVGRGTGRAVIGAEGGDGEQVANISLDSLCRDKGIDRIALLKVDTDGFDWSVIESGMETIARSRPPIFFEAELGETGEYLDDYGRVLRWLADYGYGAFHAFDNFGGYLWAEDTVEGLERLLHYVRRQNTGEAVRTIYYVDILAVSPDDSAMARSAVDRFLAAMSAGDAF